MPPAFFPTDRFDLLSRPIELMAIWNLQDNQIIIQRPTAIPENVAYHFRNS